MADNKKEPVEEDKDIFDALEKEAKEFDKVRSPPPLPQHTSY
jgi:hypothetical protein